LVLANDNDQLIRIIGKTGVIIEHLDITSLEHLLMRIAEMIREREFVDLVFPWIVAAVDNKMRISKTLKAEILTALEDLLKDHNFYLDQLQVDEINRIWNILTQF